MFSADVANDSDASDCDGHRLPLPAHCERLALMRPLMSRGTLLVPGICHAILAATADLGTTLGDVKNFLDGALATIGPVGFHDWPCAWGIRQWEMARKAPTLPDPADVIPDCVGWSGA